MSTGARDGQAHAAVRKAVPQRRGTSPPGRWLAASRGRARDGSLLLMSFVTTSSWELAEAERAFSKAVRARRRASLALRLRRRCSECIRLAVHASRGGAGGVVREIPLAAITGSVEPNRAVHFDREFRPSPAARGRWLRVWQAEHRGAALPPISVVSVADGYAVRDGHHRVSVARARNAHSIIAAIA